MKKLLLFLIGLMVTFYTLGYTTLSWGFKIWDWKHQASGEWVKGTLVDSKGQITKLTKVNCAHYVDGIYKNKQIQIPIKEIKKVENLGKENPNKQYYVVRVTNKYGETFKLTDACLGWVSRDHMGGSREDPKNYSPSGTFIAGLVFWFFNPITRKEEENEIKFYNILVVTFGIEDVGQFKWNPRTKEYYPSDYLVDPKTGEQLEWKKPEE